MSVFSLHEDTHDHVICFFKNTMLMFARHTGQQSSVATIFAQSERVRMVLVRTLHAVPRGRLRGSQQVHLPLLQQGTAPLVS